MHNLPWLRDREYPLLILPTRLMLEGLGKPYVLENVMGAKKGSKTLLKRGLEEHGLEAAWLCGAMFGKPFYRHRLFASNWLWLAPAHLKHRLRQGMPGAPRPRGSVGRWVRGAPPRGVRPSSRCHVLLGYAGRTWEGAGRRGNKKIGLPSHRDTHWPLDAGRSQSNRPSDRVTRAPAPHRIRARTASPMA